MIVVGLWLVGKNHSTHFCCLFPDRPEFGVPDRLRRDGHGSRKSNTRKSQHTINDFAIRLQVILIDFFEVWVQPNL